MFFQIGHSVFHYLTKKIFCVAPSATELNYPFKVETGHIVLGSHLYVNRA